MEDLIKVEIEPNFAGDYRLEYDGKYITLFGKDNTYAVPCYGGYVSDHIEYEEMVLVSCVAEVRNASPVIERVDDEFIYIRVR